MVAAPLLRGVGNSTAVLIAVCEVQRLMEQLGMCGAMVASGSLVVACCGGGSPCGGGSLSLSVQALPGTVELGSEQGWPAATVVPL